MTHADSSCAKPAMAEGVRVLKIYYNETGHTFALVTLATEHRKSLPQCLCMILSLKQSSITEPNMQKLSIHRCVLWRRENSLCKYLNAGILHAL